MAARRSTLLLVVACLPLASGLQPRAVPSSARPALNLKKLELHASASAAPAPGAAVPLKLALVAAVACQGALQHGIQTGMLNIPQQAIAASLGISPTSIAFSAAVSIFCAGGLMGAQAGGGIASKAGRKALLAVCTVWCTLGGLMQYGSGALATSRASAALGMLIAGRLVSGVGCGMATVGVPLYLGEVAPTEARGALGSLNQLGICVGILVAQLLGAAAQSAGVHWRWLLGVPALLGVATAVTLPFLPESPVWLAGSSKPTAAVVASLKGLREASDAAVEAEARALQADAAAAAKPTGGGGGGGGGSIWADKSLRLPLLVAGMMAVGQQWSGINAVFFYSTGFFAAAGLSNPVLGTLLASGINAVASAATVPLMEAVGRKRLLLTGAAGMLGSGLVISAGLALKAWAGLGGAAGGALDLAAIAGVLAFVSFFELGPGPIPWQIGAEIFPEEPRAAAMGAGAALNWLLNAAVGLGFPLMQAALGPLAFLPFCAVLGFWFWFTKRYVPETRGRSIADIQAEFAVISAGGVPKD